MKMENVCFLKCSDSLVARDSMLLPNVGIYKSTWIHTQEKVYIICYENFISYDQYLVYTWVESQIWRE